MANSKLGPWPVAAAMAALIATAARADPPGPSPASPKGQPIGATEAGTAVIRLSKGYKSGLGFVGNQTYQLSRNGECKDLETVATMLWTTPNQTTLKTAAGHRIVLLATTMYITSAPTPGLQGPVEMNAKACDGAVRFQAEDGHSYDVTQQAPFAGPGCTMQVLDKATGQPPADLEVGDYAFCSGFHAP